MTSPLITGSLAFDILMKIGGRFSSRLSDPAAAGFSAAFIAPEMRREFGGCAGNIAYGLRQLGEDCLLQATAGADFAPYRRYLGELGIDDSHIMEVPEVLTAQAFIASDEDESQVIVFHPGATGEAHRQSVHDLPSLPSLAIVSPNGREGMLKYSRELSASGVPFIFDPGQAIGLFSGDELREMLAASSIGIFNQDEYAAFLTITGEEPHKENKGSAIIITRGNAGSEVRAEGEVHRIAAASFGPAADTTGCGDAYRAGLLYGWRRNWEWQQIMQTATVLAGIKAVHEGGQGYKTTLAEVEEKCKDVFGG